MFKRHFKYISQEYIFFAENFCIQIKKKTSYEKKGLHMTTQAQEEKIINQNRRFTLDINASVISF